MVQWFENTSLSGGNRVMGQHRLHRLNNLLFVRQDEILQRFAVGDWRVQRSHHLYRCAKVLEAVFGNFAGDDDGRGRMTRRLVNQDQPARLAYGGQDGLDVERRQSARIDDFRADPLLCQVFGGCQRLFDHPPGCDRS